MKKIFIITLLIGLLLATVGCSNGKTTESNATNPTVQSENNNATGTPPGDTIEFDSVADIPKFISAVNSQETYYSEEYAEIYATNEHSAARAARKFADNCSDIKLFCLKSDIIYDSFGGDYSVMTNRLDTIWIINGIQYRFIYRIGSNTPIQRSDEPVLRNIKVGPFELDFYHGEDRLVGYIIDGTTTISMTVKPVTAKIEQISDIKFDAFTIMDLSKQCQ